MSPIGDIHLYRILIIEVMERNRSQTEQRLITAIEELIVEKGFEKLGVRAVAEKAKVDKTLIYRYFGSLDGLIYECLKKQDFWTNIPMEIPESMNIKEYIKELFKRQVFGLRNNDILKRLLRWELSNENNFIMELRKSREENGLNRIKIISQRTKIPYSNLAGIASIITGGITYLVMLEENCQYFNGIDISSDKGWQQLIDNINNMVDLIYNNNGN